MARELIALLEDDEERLRQLDEILTRHGYRRVYWQPGTDPYDLVRGSAPDLVVLDLSRFGRGAIDLTVVEQLRIDPATARIPAVCLADPERVQDWERSFEGLRCRTVEYPFTEEALLAGVREALAAVPGREGFDVVQEASEESFPASDAPSWTGSGIGADGA